MEGDIRDIKAALAEALAPNNKARTWAHVVRSDSAAPEPSRQNHEDGRKARMEKLRNERAKSEVTLTTRNASEKMKKQLTDMNEEQITEGLKKAMKQVNANPDLIRGVKKLPNQGLKIRCATNAEAEELGRLHWESALEGASVIKQTYGIVVHGVPKYDVDPLNDEQGKLKAQIESANNGSFKVIRVTPLRKRARNPNAPTQSIVIALEKPEDADECIISGINIEHRHYAADKHTPQCQIKQCFNCQAYGHKAEVCTKKACCGKCGQGHETRQCEDETTVHCVQCKGDHHAWHHECPARIREIERLDALRDELPPLFIL
jgi:hypothetical protein